MEFLIITMSLIFLSLFTLSFFAISRMLAQIKQKTIVISTRQLEDRLNAKTLHNNQNYTREDFLSLYQKYDFTNKYISVDKMIEFIQTEKAKIAYLKMKSSQVYPGNTQAFSLQCDSYMNAFQKVYHYIKDTTRD